jgi:uncharacterized protein with beta-barrel porin domain
LAEQGGLAGVGRWWGAGGGLFGRAAGNEDRSGARSAQGTVGYDWKAPGWLLGSALAYESTNFTVDGPSNSNAITTLRGAGYGATGFAGLTFAGTSFFSWDHVSSTRSLPTFALTATGNYDAWSLATAAEVARPFLVGSWRIEPMLGLTFVELWRPGFVEGGAGALALVAERETATKLASRLGATATTPILIADMVLRPWLRAFWARDYLDRQGELNAAFLGAAPGAFAIWSPAVGRDAALLGVGALLQLTPISSVMLAYDGELRSRMSTHSIAATAIVRW